MKNKNNAASLLLTAAIVFGTPFPAVSSVSIEENSQRAGGDYTNFLTDTPEQCAQQCDRDPQCLAFDFSTYDRRCWLKNTVPPVGYNREVISGVKKTSAPTSTWSIQVPGMRIDPNTQRAFGDYTNFISPGPEECARQCLGEDRCLAFDYSLSDRRCWLKNSVPSSRYNRDVVSGVKTKFDRVSRRKTGSAPQMRIEPDTQRAFGDYTNFYSENQQNCAEQCLHDAQCLAFDYSLPDRRCWLKNTVPSPRYNRDVVSGVKEWKSTSYKTSSSVNSEHLNNTPAQKTVDKKTLAAQAVLSRLGYYHGAVDGIPGNKTRQAIEQFQKEHSLVPTGILDQQTFNLLLEPDSSPGTDHR